jgi:UDP:flavonoid glycosyltransferase YjiC (YdhE family)
MIDLPEWMHELDGKRRVVLVTQGTVANSDLTQLLERTMSALADEKNIIVIATTGHRPIQALQASIPPNARVSTFSPFDRILPKVDLVVTNGGYGTVNLALRHGIPMVAAGMTEDKAEVTSRIAWSGVGINLRTTTPSIESLRSAILTALDTPTYRTAAQRMASEFANLDTEKLVRELILDLVT